MTVPKEINKLLANKYVLYIVAFLSLTNVLAYLVAQDYNSLLFFAIIGYLTSYFSKNMTVILLFALIITNLLMTAKSLQNRTIRNMQREGLESMNKVGKVGKVKVNVEVDEDEEDEGDTVQPKKIKQIQANMMSPNKVADMNVEAKSLLASQEALAQNLETMGPLLNTAKEMMDTLSGAEGMLSQLGGLGGML
jgi:hypothetical protein